MTTRTECLSNLRESSLIRVTAVAGTECVEVCCMPAICQGLAQKGQVIDEVQLLDYTVRIVLMFNELCALRLAH